jgi:hypothetical protein
MEGINPNVWLHAIDLCGYGTTQFDPHDRRNNFLAGWSEKLLAYIGLYEKGINTLVKSIEEYDRKSYTLIESEE